MNEHTLATSDLYYQESSAFSDAPTATRVSSTTQVYRARESSAAVTSLQAGELMVYAMRVDGGLIKIGCTKNLARRRSQLDGELLGFMFGDFDDEASIHASLAEHVHHGREWYFPTDAVLSAVNGMRETFNLEPLAA